MPFAWCPHTPPASHFIRICEDAYLIIHPSDKDGAEQHSYRTTALSYPWPFQEHGEPLHTITNIIPYKAAGGIRILHKRQTYSRMASHKQVTVDIFSLKRLTFYFSELILFLNLAWTANCSRVLQFRLTQMQ